MMDNYKRNVQDKNWFRIVARIIGVIVGVCGFLASCIPLTLGEPVGLEEIMFIVLFAILIASVIIAWRREKIGGILLIVCAIAIGIDGAATAEDIEGILGTLLMSELGTLLISGSILLAGILFLLSNCKARGRKLKKVIFRA